MIILDTCVISETMRPRPSESVLEWIEGLPENEVYLPTLVLGELRHGIDRLDAGKKRVALDRWLEQLRVRFHRRILAIDEETALAWGALSARLETSGKPMPLMDSLIAAVAERHGAVLATRNTDDFAAAGIQTVNPWQDPIRPLNR